MTSTDDSDRGGPGPRPRASHFAGAGSRAGFGPQFESPQRERFYHDTSANFRPPQHPGPSVRAATWHALPSREELSARKRLVQQSIQAEADAAVAELEERRRFSRTQRRQSRMSSRPDAFDANYVGGLEEHREREDDIEELCDILLEEYGVEVEPLPAGARAPIYGPTVRPAWPVTTEGMGRERERERERMSRMSRESRYELDSSENEAREEDEEDEELVESMSRGRADRLMAQTSLRGAYHGYKRPSRRHDPYDDDSSYDAPSRPKPKPGGPGPAPPTGSGTSFSMGEDEARERKRDWERDREMMREREIMREREMRRERDLRREREMRRDELDREMAKRRQKAENEEEWEDLHRHDFVRMSPIVVTQHPPSDPQYDHTRRSHSEYDIRHTESYREPHAAANAAYEAGYRPVVEIRRRRRSENLGSAPRSRSRSRSRSPPGIRDVYMHGGRHADDAPAPAPREGESEDDGVRTRGMRRMEVRNYQGF